jgi:hypothetical protein
MNRVDVAKIQLDTAIQFHFDGNWVISISLAGAAEGIFGEMLQRRNIQNALDKIQQLPPMLNFSQNTKDRKNFLNYVKNNIKHARDVLEDEVDVNELESYLMLVRAVGNAELLNVGDTKNVKRFRDTYSTKSE